MTIVALILMHANGTWLAMPLRNLHHYYCSLVHARPAGTPWLVRGAHYFGGTVHVVAMSRKLWRGIGWVCWCRWLSTAASPLR